MVRIKTTTEVEAKSPGGITTQPMVVNSHLEYDDKVMIQMRDGFPKIVVDGKSLIMAIEKCMKVEI